MIRRLLAAVTACLCCSHAVTAEPAAGPVWAYAMPDIDGKEHPFAQHRGEVLLIVNVASKCGFTKQYAGLQALHQRFQGQGFSVIGVPSNDFGVLGGQEPGSNGEIRQFCTTTYGVTFPMMAKQVVKGDGMHPLFRFLTTTGPRPEAVSWNFNKFLIGRDGQVLAHFGSRVAPEDAALTDAISTALAAPSRPATPAATAR